VISGHRDTHFRFLRRLAPGDEVVVEGVTGGRAATSSRACAWWTGATLDHGGRGDTRLTLVTCYPFDAIRPGGPLRYVVVAPSVDG